MLEGLVAAAAGAQFGLSGASETLAGRSGSTIPAVGRPAADDLWPVIVVNLSRWRCLPVREPEGGAGQAVRGPQVGAGQGCRARGGNGAPRQARWATPRSNRTQRRASRPHRPGTEGRAADQLKPQVSARASKRWEPCPAPLESAPLMPVAPPCKQYPLPPGRKSTDALTWASSAAVALADPSRAQAGCPWAGRSRSVFTRSACVREVYRLFAVEGVGAGASVTG